MRKFWKNKKVFITGHTGFKGSWLALWLVSMGANVTGFSLEAPFNPNLFKLANIEKKINHINGDIRDLESLKKEISSFKPDVIFHMAAQSLVRTSYEFPVETFNTNVMGTVNVLEAMKETCEVKVCVNITSDKCYENREDGKPFIETDPMGGYDPYSCSKGCAELVTSAYKRSFLQDRGIASVRAGNVIGGGDWSDARLIPDIIRSILNNQDIILRNPQAIRPWQHVLEPLRGYLILAEALWNDNNKFSHAWNFGPELSDALPVKQISEKIINIWGSNSTIKVDSNNNPHEANYLKLDCSLVQNKLNWKPVFNIDKALEFTANWYKAYQDKENIEDFSINQIQNYEKQLEVNKCKK